MIVLALEFSSARRGVAVVHRAEGLSIEVLATVSDDAPRGASGLTLVERALGRAQLAADQVEALAVALGPGSYTGIRASLAIAQGWQLARGTPILTASSLDCLACQAQKLAWHGVVRTVVDAQRGELYVATYQVSAKRFEVIEPVRLASVDAIVSDADHTPAMVVGPEVTRWFPAGRELFPDAATLASVANMERPCRAGEELQPIYLRETNFVKAPPPRKLPDGSN